MQAPTRDDVFRAAAAERPAMAVRHAALQRALIQEWVAVVGVMGLGLLVRLRYVLSSDGFPLGDGGMFAQMIRELQRAHYLLPRFTAYNNAHVPFAYPPLGLYVTGLLADATHLPLYTVMTLVSVGANVLAIGMIYLFARSFLAARAAALAATLVFAITPATFWFPIMGGGITRSFGLLFALAALWQLQLLNGCGRRRYIFGAGIAAGLTALSHPECALFVAESAAVFLIAGSDRARRLRDHALAAVVALALAGPWLLLVIGRHGVAPFLHALTTGHTGASGLVSLITFGITEEPLFPVLAGLALLGICACFVARRPLLIGWLLLAFVLNARGARTYGAVPLALLAGIAIGDVLLPLLAGAGRLSAAAGATDDAPAPADRRWQAMARWAVLGTLVAYAALSAASVPASYLAALPRDERAAMQWVARSTPPDSRFLVLGVDQMSPDGVWEFAMDRTTEWFPVLAQRTSASTVEGQEWRGDFDSSMRTWFDAFDCTSRGAQCLDDLSLRDGVTYTHVFLPKGPGEDVPANQWCCWSLRTALRTDPAYVVIYDGPGATVLARRTAS